MGINLLFCRRILGGLAIAALGMNSAAAADPDEFAGPNLLAGAVMVQTGGSSPLVRTNIPWLAPTNLSHPALVFAFGFGSDEVFTPGEFFDSLSVTLRATDGSYTAPVLTADALGVTIAPSNPDGSELAEDPQTEGLTFPDVGSSFRFQQAFLVLVVLPQALAGKNGTIAVTLFDNLDSESSVGFINHLSVVPGPGTTIALESSAAVNGPYAEEGAVVVHHARRRLQLPRSGAHRFFRLRSAVESRITHIRRDARDLAFEYTGAVAGMAPILESSARVTGPYASESGVHTDPGARILRAPLEGVARFFRIRSEAPLHIRTLRMDASHMTMGYELPRP